jgi:cephalosporin hydroxylase
MEITLEAVTAAIDQHNAQGQHPREVFDLLRFLADNPHTNSPPKLIIEVGVWLGGNAAVYKTFFPDVRIIGVDVVNRTEFDGVEMVVGNSGDGGTRARVEELLDGQKADFLFIDADHVYASVKRDYEMWRSLAQLVGFHDVHNPSVLRFWQETTALQLIESDGVGPTFALWKEWNGHGIGVILQDTDPGSH